MIRGDRNKGIADDKSWILASTFPNIGKMPSAKAGVNPAASGSDAAASSTPYAADAGTRGIAGAGRVHDLLPKRCRWRLLSGYLPVDLFGRSGAAGELERCRNDS
ncbi:MULTISPECIES: hypothetical protein [Mesorhizobium]|uniref:hypothetical protein n=1 Tax=Mesorhizobium TaxID=68287 RepID=UPI000A9714C5|nr:MULTISPECIES: hypothetical protein [Mesorhizobium]